MNNKIELILIIVAIILLCFGALHYFSLFNQQQLIEVGDVIFVMPDGYHEGDLNSNGDLKITNGSDNIYFAVYNESDINTFTQNYVKSLSKKNINASIQNLSFGNLNVYKSYINDTSDNHYWFKYDNKVYTIYTWKHVENIDDLISELINSMKNKNQ